jgi:hypothetical protein
LKTRLLPLQDQFLNFWHNPDFFENFAPPFPE